MERKWGTTTTVMAIMLTVVILLGCVGAGSSTPAAAAPAGVPLKMGLSLGDQSQERWVLEERMMQAFCDERGIEFMSLVAGGSVETQLAQVESMISAGVNAVFVRAVDSAAAGTIAQMTRDAGVLYIAYDTATLGGPVDFYVTFDNILVGYEQARALVAAAPTGNYVLLNGHPVSTVAQWLNEGAMEYLQPFIDNGVINLVSDQWCNAYSPEEARQHAENALTANNNNIQAILAANDTMAGAVIAVLETQGLAGTIPVSGQDAELAACQRIVEGTQLMTIYKPIRRMNRSAMEIVYAALTGADIESSVSGGTWGVTDNNFGEVRTYYHEVIAVTKDNMMETIIADGFHSKEEVYANIPRSEWPE